MDLSYRPVYSRWATGAAADEGSGAGVGRDDGAVAVGVGAEDLGASAGQEAEGQWARVAVAVARADADHGDLGAHRVQEVRGGVARAVMRHLEHVGGEVDPGVEQVELGGQLHVSGE